MNVLFLYSFSWPLSLLFNRTLINSSLTIISRFSDLVFSYIVFAIIYFSFFSLLLFFFYIYFNWNRFTSGWAAYKWRTKSIWKRWYIKYQLHIRQIASFLNDTMVHKWWAGKLFVSVNSFAMESTAIVYFYLFFFIQ